MQRAPLTRGALCVMCVAFTPFPTALLADYIPGTEEHRTTAVAVYSGKLDETAIFFTLLWLYAAGNHRSWTGSSTLSCCVP